ncbi:MAG TPA: hypothetical protein VNS19_17235 [Acidimicrobiales bacterium]|nr:hypothetical protein [Acidimicrobiales bacterium]
MKTGDAEQMTNSIRGADENAQCCAPSAISESAAIGTAPGAPSGCC